MGGKTKVGSKPRKYAAPVTVEELCSWHNVDMAHARHVAGLSLALFDALPKTHRIPASLRGLLGTAAMLHNVGYAANPRKHHTVGRDLILAESISGYQQEERDMLACLSLFHRKKVKPHKEPVFQALPPARQKETLELAALLRVADALDYSQTQTCRIVSVQQNLEAVRLIVDGPYADEEATRANQKADLWNKIFSPPLVVVTAGQSAAEDSRGPAKRAREETLVGTASASLSSKPGLRPDDSVAVAGRKVLQFHFGHLLESQSGVQKEKSVRALHRMRIVTRRLRASSRLFGPYLPKKRVRPAVKALRRMARILGPVRDFDVLLSKARNYIKNVPESKRWSLRLLLRTWGKRRAGARKRMLKYFGSRKYDKARRAFEALLAADSKSQNGPAAEAVNRKPRTDILQHVAPTLIWKQYERVRRFETVMPDAPVETIHALRIQCKRLRYTLELLREVLGTSAEPVIAQLKQVQDYLGDLHDTDVTIGLVRKFLDGCGLRVKRKDAIVTDFTGVMDYLNACERELDAKVKSFSPMWAELISEQFRWLLGELTATP